LLRICDPAMVFELDPESCCQRQGRSVIRVARDGIFEAGQASSETVPVTSREIRKRTQVKIISRPIILDQLDGGCTSTRSPDPTYPNIRLDVVWRILRFAGRDG
jgi:hypothetical protein